ncbi:hypothetical protein [Streptomyces sp. NPDC021212]|uniref:hypothetical protein n=1 Tax=Streptomyces sp. NPDC021212 TaxID=3365118 RepID=UPI0037A4E9BC
MQREADSLRAAHDEPGTVRRAYASKTVGNLHGLLRDSNPCAQAPAEGDEAEGDEVFLEPEEYALPRAPQG